MDSAKDGLDEKDINILASYAKAGNRELYFNYLAQKEGNDGYGLLALGVVRNDNVPGATANSFADRQARADGAQMTESKWQAFGIELMVRDLALRKEHLDSGRPHQTLNLPVEDIQASHDPAFRDRGIDPSAWTPYKLLEAARAHGGKEEAEQVWKMLLDNQNLGLDRGGETSALILGKYRDLIDNPAGYIHDMAQARLPHGLQPTSHQDPNRIPYQGKEYVLDEKLGQWREPITLPLTVQAGVLPIPVGKLPVGSREVTDPQTLRYLEDAHDVRQHRQQLRTQFHPDDPNRTRPIKASPWLLSDAAPTQEYPDEALLAGTAPQPIPPIPLTRATRCTSNARMACTPWMRDSGECLTRTAHVWLPACPHWRQVTVWTGWITFC